MGLIYVAVVVGEVSLDKAKDFDLQVCRCGENVIAIPLDHSHLKHWALKLKKEIWRENISPDFLPFYLIRKITVSGRYAIIYSDAHGGAKSEQVVVFEGNNILMEEHLGEGESVYLDEDSPISSSDSPVAKAFTLLGTESKEIQNELSELDLWEFYEPIEHYKKYQKFT